MNGGGGTGSSHEDMRLSRLYQQLVEWQEPGFGQEYDLASGLDQYRAWLGKHSEGAQRDASPAGSPVARPAGPGAANADEQPEGRGALPVSVTQALVAASGAFQSPLTGGMEWGADLAVMELYAQHYRALVRLAAMLVRDTPTAEEVVQDAFVAVHDGWHRLKDTEKALAYLRQAVVNKSRSVLRHRMVVEKNLQDAPPDMPSAEHGAFVLLERSAVIAALRDLPPRQREAIVLRYYLDLSEAEIAAAMRITRGAVKSHTARGMAALRAALEQELWPVPAQALTAPRDSGMPSPSSCVALCTTRSNISSRRQTAWSRFARGSPAGPRGREDRAEHGHAGGHSVTDFEDDTRADEADVREWIERYADELRAAGAIRSPRVERAFRTVQRHRLLDRHYRDLDARGRPAIGDYQVSFLPIDTECDPPPGGWQVKRRFYRELVTLGVRPEGEQRTGARTEDRSA